MLPDEWLSYVNGIGNPLFDKRMSSFASVPEISYQQCIDIWRSDPMGARAVEVLPRETVRAGIELVIGDEKDDGLKEKIERVLRDVGAIAAARRGFELERAVGGSALLLGVSDGGAMDKQLRLQAIKSFDWVNVLEPVEVYPHKHYDDAMAPKYGEPEIYQVTGGGSGNIRYVHESRLHVFPGIKVSRYQTQSTSAGSSTWGDSIFVRVQHVLRDFANAAASVGILITDFSQPVLSLEGYAGLVNAEGPKALRERFLALELARSIARAIVLDTNEKYERQTTQVAGLRELLDWLATNLAGALEMPITKLMGQSPKGLGNEGASDREFWFDVVESAWTDKMHPALHKMTQLAFYAVAKKEPGKWDIRHKPYWQESATEVATRHKTQADADHIYIEDGVLTREEVRKSRFEGEYSLETQLDQAAWDAEQDRRAEMEAAALEAAGRGPGGEDPEDPEGGPGGGGGLDPEDPEYDGEEIEALEEELEEDALDELELAAEDDDDTVWDLDEHVNVREDGIAVLLATTALDKGAAGVKKAPGSKGYNPYRANNGKFAPGAHKKPDPAARKERIAELATATKELRANESHFRKRAVEAKAGMSASKKAAKANPAEAAKHKAAFETHAKIREFAQMRAGEAKTERASLTAELKKERAAAKTERAEAAAARKKAAAEKKAAVTAKKEAAAKAKAEKVAAKEKAAKEKGKPTAAEKKAAKAKAEKEAAVAELQKEAEAAKAKEKAAAIEKWKSEKGAPTVAMMAAEKSSEMVAFEKNMPKSSLSDEKFLGMQDKFTKSLTRDEKRAALDYSSMEYTKINNYLRGTKSNFGTENPTATEAGRYKDDLVPNLDRALSKNRTTENMVTVRGSAMHPAFKDMKPGDTFTDKAYVSTSRDHNNGYVAGSPVIFSITIPKGSKAGAIPSQFENEREILIGRGTKFRLDKREQKDVTENGYVRTIMHVTVVDQD